MPTLYVTRGLPGSGKSTWAKAWVAEQPTRRARVNRDDLRAMLHDSTHIKGGSGQPGTEQSVIAARDAMVVSLLRRSVDVVVDETCLPERVLAELRRLADRAGARLEAVDFRHVPVETCIERDGRREGRAQVGEQVIRQMYDQHMTRPIAA